MISSIAPTIAGTENKMRLVVLQISNKKISVLAETLEK